MFIAVYMTLNFVINRKQFNIFYILRDKTLTIRNKLLFLYWVFFKCWKIKRFLEWIFEGVTTKFALTKVVEGKKV